MSKMLGGCVISEKLRCSRKSGIPLRFTLMWKFELYYANAKVFEKILVLPFILHYLHTNRKPFLSPTATICLSLIIKDKNESRIILK